MNALFLKPTDEQRALLRKPFGRLLRGSREEVALMLSKEARDGLLACVGDYVSTTALDAGVRTTIFVVDSRTERRGVCLDRRLNQFPRHNLTNPAGLINFGAWALFSSIITKWAVSVVLVEGEEDLLTLPVLDIAPLGSKTLYGQPDEGAVLVTADEDVKLKVRSMVAEMHSVAEP